MGLMASIFWILGGLVYVAHQLRKEHHGCFLSSAKQALCWGLPMCAVGLCLTVADLTSGGLSLAFSVIVIIVSVLALGFILWVELSSLNEKRKNARIRAKVDAFMPTTEQLDDVIRRNNIHSYSPLAERLQALDMWREELLAGKHPDIFDPRKENNNA